MIQLYKRMQRMREKYVDTLAKLYEYATTVYSKNQYTQWYDTKKGGYTYGSFKSKCDSMESGQETRSPFFRRACLTGR